VLHRHPPPTILRVYEAYYNNITRIHYNIIILCTVFIFIFIPAIAFECTVSANANKSEQCAADAELTACGRNIIIIYLIGTDCDRWFFRTEQSIIQAMLIFAISYAAKIVIFLNYIVIFSMKAIYYSILILNYLRIYIAHLYTIKLHHRNGLLYAW